MSLESYLDTCVQMACKPDWDVEYVIGKRRSKLAQNLARMNDYELGEWLAFGEDTGRAVEDAVLLIGQDRFADALENLHFINVERILVDAANTFLEETQEEKNVEMPEELDGLEDEEELATKLYNLRNNDKLARALIVLSSEEKLLILLRKKQLNCYNVAMILVGFYEELMED